MYLFEVNTETGISIPEMSLTQNIYDEGVKPPSELLPPKLNNSGLDDRQTLPNPSYKLNLAVYYDNDFFNQFPSATLQMFAGIYGGFIGKSECGDFKFMGIACNPQSL